jgi:hypothetical protein
MIGAFKMGRNDAVDAQLVLRLKHSKEKEAILELARRRYSELGVECPVADTHRTQDKRSGRVDIELVKADHIEGRSVNAALVAEIRVDDILRYTSATTFSDWSDTISIEFENAVEFEISVISNNRVVALTWIKFCELEEYQRISDFSIRSLNDAVFKTIEMEPSGHLLLRTFYSSGLLHESSTTDTKGSIARREPVRKVYPKNGHLFVAKEFYQPAKCAFCCESLEHGHGFNCQTCAFLIHPACYKYVITKCMTGDEVERVQFANQMESPNSGQ